MSLSRILSLVLGLAMCLLLMAIGITRETPMGSVAGRALMGKSGKPLANAQVTLVPLTPLKPGDEYRQVDPMRKGRASVTDAEGKFSFRTVEAGEYEIEITGKAHRTENVIVLAQEGKPVEQTLEVEPIAPYMDLYASKRVVKPGEPVELSANGFIKGEALKVRAYRLKPELLLKNTSIYNALSSLRSTSWQKATADPKTAGVAVATLDKSIESRDVEGVFTERIGLGELGEGLYWVTCSLGGIERGTWFSVSSLSLVTKYANGETMAFASDLESGQPRPGVRLTTFVNGQPKQVGETDANGLAKLSINVAGNFSAVLQGQSGESMAFVNFAVSRYSGEPLQFFTYTERPVYRPGDEVSFKGIIRRLNGDDYALPDGGTIEVEVRDEDSNLIKQMSLPVSALGTYHGSFGTNRESRPGMYSLMMKYAGQSSSHYVSISAYRKPEFSIKLTPEKPSYLRGERVRMKLEAEYFFGGPVQGAAVEATISRAPSWDFGPMDADVDEDEYSDGYYGGEYVQTIKATTDSSGRAWIEFQADVGTGEEVAYTDTLFQVYASIADASGKYFDGEGTVKVLRGGVATHIESSAWFVKPDAPVTMTVLAYNPGDKKPIPNQEIALEAGYEVWAGNTAVFQPFSRETVKTDAKGRASVTLTGKRPGDLVLKARTRDAQGNVSESRQSVWIDAGGTVEQTAPSDETLEVMLDKRRYQPGEKAKVLVRTSKPGGSAWITVEGDKVLWSGVVSLEKGSFTLDLPILDDYAPNAFVSAVYVVDQTFSQRSRRLAVDLDKREMVVTIAPDRKEVEPGDTVGYTLKATDRDGRPIQAEFSFGVVDEAIYAIQEEAADIVASFYPKRWNAVNTSYSFEEIYLDGGDKAPKNIEIRKRFKDTAFWLPAVMTGADGTAKVQVELPDNLTTWRATAIGVSSKTDVGQATAKVMANKDLMVRLDGPGYMIREDEQRIVAMVTNDSGKDAEVNVELDADLVTLKGDKRQKVRVANGQTASIEWMAAAPVSGLAKLTARAWIDDSTTDGVQLAFNVRARGRLYVESSANMIENGVGEFTINVKEGADLPTGRTVLRFTPSLAGIALGSLDDLINYPYGCVEQTMSRFLPLIAVSEAMRQNQIAPPSRAAEIPRMVSEGFKRLQQMQQSDGGWGWWENDSSNPELTAYVLEGLARAKAGGYDPGGTMISRGIARAKAMTEEKWDANLSESDKKLASVVAYRKQAHARGQAHLALALALLGERPTAQRALLGLPKLDDTESIVSALLAANALGLADSVSKYRAELKARATRNAGLVSWDGRWGVEGTARATLALLIADPSDPDIPLALRSLAVKRRGSGWFSTRDTAAAVLAISAFAMRAGGGPSTGEVRVLVNGKPISTFTVDPGELESPDFAITVPFESLNQGENAVRIEAPGFPTGSFAAETRQTVGGDDVGSLSTDGDLSIERAYYRLSSVKLENGESKVLPGEKTIDRVRAGDLVRVIVRVTVKRPMEYVMIEDPIPAGVRIQDRGPLSEGDEWSYWWSSNRALDDRMTFFVDELAQGTHEFTYVFRAENPGDSIALPATMANMYDPERYASSMPTPFKVDR